MKIIKLGHEHRLYDIPCQDFAVEWDNSRLVVDGCSDGKHSEIGSKLFCHLISTLPEEIPFHQRVEIVFAQIIDMLGKDPVILKDYLSFTMIYAVDECKGTEGITFIHNCGDGYIFFKGDDDEYIYINLNKDDGPAAEYPEYFVYNYIDPKYFKVPIKADINIGLYTADRIGIASDGLRFILENPELKSEFEKILDEDKEFKLKLFCNRHKEQLKDDLALIY